MKKQSMHRPLNADQATLRWHLLRAGFPLAAQQVHNFSMRKMDDSFRIAMIQYWVEKGTFHPTTLSL